MIAGLPLYQRYEDHIIYEIDTDLSQNLEDTLACILLRHRTQFDAAVAGWTGKDKREEEDLAEVYPSANALLRKFNIPKGELTEAPNGDLQIPPLSEEEFQKIFRSSTRSKTAPIVFAKKVARGYQLSPLTDMGESLSLSDTRRSELIKLMRKRFEERTEESYKDMLNNLGIQTLEEDLEKDPSLKADFLHYISIVFGPKESPIAPNPQEPFTVALLRLNEKAFLEEIFVPTIKYKRGEGKMELPYKGIAYEEKPFGENGSLTTVNTQKTCGQFTGLEESEKIENAKKAAEDENIKIKYAFKEDFLMFRLFVKAVSDQEREDLRRAIFIKELDSSIRRGSYSMSKAFDDIKELGAVNINRGVV
ncbi:hypothetical protein IPG41_00705 [Candidatus Peregrinibacteria bacterium]|nr:MAG: hypothetical protein IPG41_00705 [Candidatus Peregrinibacteria bacterium]